jgi:hypothetical protein
MYFCIELVIIVKYILTLKLKNTSYIIINDIKLVKKLLL